MCAQSVLINKISATELNRKSIKSELLVGWQVQVVEIVYKTDFKTTVQFSAYLLIALGG